MQRAEPIADSDEVAYIEKALGIAGGAAAVLDVPCGVGRHALVLASHGHRVMAVDRNPAALEIGRREAEARGLGKAVRFEVAQMTEVLPRDDGPFDAALCFFGSIGYGSEADDLAFFRRVRQALRRGGRFLVDVHVAETLLPAFEPRDWHSLGEGASRMRVLEERHWNHLTSRVETTWIFQPAGGPEVERRTSIRIYTVRELVELAGGAGFSFQDAAESITGAAFGLGAGRLGLVLESVGDPK